MGRDLAAIDNALRREGFRWLCGVDEVGRGPLAGPVVAAAVVLPPDTELPGLDDSKKLSAKRRGALEPVIREAALAVGVGFAAPEEIDRINILRASLRAMERAVSELASQGHPPDYLLIDGNQPVDLTIPQQTLVGGDGRSASIAAASIIAKELRDRLMCDYAQQYPGYGFELHMGYPTAAHRAALAELGPCPIHRTSFKGVRELVHPTPRPVRLL